MQWLDNGSSLKHPLRRAVIYILVKLAAESGEYPPSLFITGVDVGSNRDPVATGGLADIFRGTYQGQDVAVKRLRMSDSMRAETHRVCLANILKRY
jgi:hypothetical protein